MKIQIIGGTYNETTQRTVLSFIEVVPDGHPDPINFKPSVILNVQLPPGQVEIIQLHPQTLEVQEEDKPGKTPKG